MREGADPQVLIAAAKRYRDDPIVLRGWGKHPATWLRAKCWLDEDTPAPQEIAPAGQPSPVSRRQQETNAMFERAMQRAEMRERGQQ